MAHGDISRPDASVVIPCRGHSDSLAVLLRDIATQETTRRVETIVVDSASDPAVLQAARAANARVVRGASPLLPGVARNLGASVAGAPVLLFVDADCRAEGTWLESAVVALRSSARLVSGPIVDLHPQHPIARTDNLLQFADLPRERAAGPLHMAPSCNLAVGAVDFAALGGFVHRDGVATGEDVALCERAISLWPDAIAFVPSMVVRHAGRRTLVDLLRHQREFGRSRGRLRLLLSERQVRLGALTLFVPAIVLRRLLYVVGRVWRWRPSALPATFALLPLIALGAGAWTLGFQAGLRESTDTAEPDA